MPLRVLHVISGIDPEDGGPTTALTALAHALNRAGIDVTLVATPRTSGHLETVDELLSDGVRVRLSEPRRNIFTRDCALDSLLAEEITHADVVHIHALWEDVQYRAASVSRALGKPFVIRPCGLLEPWSMARHRFKKRLYLEVRLRRYLDAASGIHFSTAIEEERTRPLRLKAPPIVEPNGLDFTEHKRSSLSNGSFRALWNIEPETPIVLFLGRLHPKKGVDLLIPAFARGAPRNAVLVIAGSGDSQYESSLKQRVLSSGLANRVIFTGFIEGQARNATLADATVFVLPSHSESFANTVVESIACGTPVIVSDQVALHPEVSSKRVGSVVPATIDALAVEIETWLVDRSKRISAIANADDFLKSYDLKLVADRWINRYNSLCHTTETAHVPRSSNHPARDAAAMN